MSLKILKSLFVVLMFIQFGCTSKSADDGAAELTEAPLEGDEVMGEGEDVLAEGGEEAGDLAEGAEEASDDLSLEGEDFEDGDFAEGGEGSEEFGEGDFAEGEDEFAADFGDEEGAEGETADNADSLEDPLAEPAPEEDIAALDSAPPVEEELTPQPEIVDSAPIEEPLALGSDEMGEDTSYMEEPSAPRFIPVKKMAEAPYRKNGVLVNAIYIARPGDDMAKVSQTIYQSDRTEELYNVNPHFRSKSLKVGDKVYYNSPQRPADDSRLLTFYEDFGLSPEIYVTQPGDNIRTLSKSLLGDQRSWMEIYATNPAIESKGDLEAGQQIRYWASAGMVAANPPQAPEPSPEPASEALPPSPDPMADLPPPSEPSMDYAQNDLPPAEESLPPPAESLPPPPEEMNAGAGSMSDADLAPPPPPPPPPMEQMDMAQVGGDVGSEDALTALLGDDQTMAMIAAAILLLAAVALIAVIRKRKRRTIDFATGTHTQIE